VAPVGPRLAGSCCEIVGVGHVIPLGAGARQMVAPFHRTSVGDFLAGGPAILCAAHGYASRVTSLY